MTAPHVAYDRIRSAIVEGRFRPGEHLVETRIAEQFALSRTPVREAIRRLEAEGLVVSQPHRGAVVRPISADEIVDVYELRGRLESYAAELAAQRRTDEELEQLSAAVERFGLVSAAAKGRAVATVRRLNEANGAIHGLIVVAAHHERLAAMLRRTVDIPLVFQAFRSFDDGQRARSDLFHRLILAAIEQRDGGRAGRLMREHVSLGLDAVLAGLPTHVEGEGRC